MRAALTFVAAIICLVHTASSQNITLLVSHKYAVPVIVSIQQQWTDSGINVSVNDSVEIVVKGIASTSGATDSKIATWMGPEGDGTSIAPAGFNAPGVAPQSVIGKIGTSGTGFYVGSSRAFKVLAAGRLYLGYNDDPSRSWPENFGYYVAYVVKHP
jgi:hypothetical protein